MFVIRCDDAGIIIYKYGSASTLNYVPLASLLVSIL